MVDQYSNEHYHSRIEDIASQSITIAMPMSKGYPVQLNRGGQFFAKVFINGSVYQFRSILLGKRIHPIPVWIVSKPTDVKKIQQRAFVRIDAMIPVKVLIISDDGEEQVLRLMTKDISGGGLRLVCKQALKLGVNLRLFIELPDVGTLQTSAEVVRVDKPDNERALYWVGVKYINIPDSLRSKIIRFVFKKQLEYRQRGL